jgi:anti-sigma regulatory factor (Ser/Thr protein kinase)
VVSGKTHPVTAGPVRVDFPSPPDGPTRDLAAALTPVLDALVRGTGQLEVLPESPPLPAGWELTARNARSDVLTLPDGDLLISVVAVAGDGPGAELTSALVRTAVRVLAAATPPATIPARLGGLPAVEVLLVRVDPDTGALLWTSAGGTDVHPLRPPAPAAEVALPDFDTTWVLPLAATSAAAVRRHLRAVLDSDQTDPDLLTDLQVAATEAVNNAVEHAQHPTRPEVHVRLLVTGGLVRVEVRDFGTWRERPPARDRGRGATLMNAYGDVRVTTTGTGTLVTIERRWSAG